MGELVTRARDKCPAGIRVDVLRYQEAVAVPDHNRAGWSVGESPLTSHWLCDPEQVTSQETPFPHLTGNQHLAWRRVQLVCSYCLLT